MPVLLQVFAMEGCVCCLRACVTEAISISATPPASACVALTATLRGEAGDDRCPLPSPLKLAVSVGGPCHFPLGWWLSHEAFLIKSSRKMTFNYGASFSLGLKDINYFHQIGAILVLFLNFNFFPFLSPFPF